MGRTWLPPGRGGRFDCDFAALTIPERRAQHHFADQRPRPLPSFCSAVRQLLNRAAIAILQTAAQRIAEHLPGQQTQKIVLLLISACRSSTGPSNFSPEGSAPLASMAEPSDSLSRQRPVQSKFSSAKPIGSIRLWHAEQAGFYAVTRISCFMPTASFARSRNWLRFTARAAARSGAAGNRRPEQFSSTQAPRSTGLVWR